MELITGPLAVGQSFDLSSIKMADFLARLDAVDLTTPVHPLPAKEIEMIEYIARNSGQPPRSAAATAH